MEPGLRCTIFPATVAVVLGPVQPHYFWEPNSHGPRNRRASSAFLALFPGIVSFVTSRAAFQPVNVCAGRSVFPVFSFRKGNLKFRMQPLFSSIYCVSFCFVLYFVHLAPLLCCSVCICSTKNLCSCTHNKNKTVFQSVSAGFFPLHNIYSVTFHTNIIFTIYAIMLNKASFSTLIDQTWQYQQIIQTNHQIYYSHVWAWLTIQAWWHFPVCNPLYHPSFQP